MIQEFKSKIKPGGTWWKLWAIACLPKTIFYKPFFQLYKNGLLKKILETPSFECNPKSETEIHSLVCHKDMEMFLLAIKSFLRFYNNVAVIVHDDGTLTKDDIEKFETHISNIKVIRKEEADRIINKKLKKKPNCRYFRDVYPNSKQLFDYNILSKKNKLISFDSDLIFFKKPKEVGRWLAQKNKVIFYNQENEILPHIELFKKYKIRELGNLNCGFMGYYKDAVDFGYVERTIRKIRNKKGWMWAQAYFNALFYNCKYDSLPLDEKKYFILNLKARTKKKDAITGGETMIHFTNYYGKNSRFKKGYYFKFIKKMIKELKNLN